MLVPAKIIVYALQEVVEPINELLIRILFLKKIFLRMWKKRQLQITISAYLDNWTIGCI